MMPPIIANINPANIVAGGVLAIAIVTFLCIVGAFLVLYASFRQYIEKRGKIAPLPTPPKRYTMADVDVANKCFKPYTGEAVDPQTCHHEYVNRSFIHDHNQHNICRLCGDVMIVASSDYSQFQHMSTGLRDACMRSDPEEVFSFCLRQQPIHRITHASRDITIHYFKLHKRIEVQVHTLRGDATHFNVSLG